MASIALPQAEAQQRAMAQQLKALQTNIATEVFSTLVAIEYQKAIRLAQHEDDPLGTKEAGEPTELRIEVDCGFPARVAVGASLALMHELGYPVSAIA